MKFGEVFHAWLDILLHLRQKSSDMQSNPHSVYYNSQILADLPRASLLFMKLILDCLADVWDRKLFCVSSDKLLYLLGIKKREKKLAAVVKLHSVRFFTKLWLRDFYHELADGFILHRKECLRIFEISRRLIEIDCNLLFFNFLRYMRNRFAANSQTTSARHQRRSINEAYGDDE